MDNKHQADRLRALYKSARDKFQSFFVTLNEVRQEIGDDALPSWCFNELHIGISMITQLSSILSKHDETRIKTELAAARRAEQLQREQAKRDEELKREEHKKKLEEERAAAARARAERKKTDDTEKRRQKKQKNKNERGSKASAKRRGREGKSNVNAAGTLGELAAQVKRALDMCKKGDNLWIEGTIIAALAVAKARAVCPADQEFGIWCDVHLDMQRDDRAALIGLGNLGEKPLREILTNTNSRSYRQIWKDNRPAPSLRVVE